MLHTTIDPENYAYLKKAGINAGKLLDTALNELRTKTKADLVLICQTNEKEVDPMRFERMISAMSRRRHNQLDHESSHTMCFNR